MSARSLNKVLLIGNLTRDPELRYTPSGTAVCTFGLATNRSWTPTDGGERQEETEYHRIVAWSKLAEICAQLLYKGRKVFVEGRMQTRKWTTQEGTERETTEVVIDNMIALGAPKGGNADDTDYGPSEYAAPMSAPSTQNVPAVDVVADDSAASDDQAQQIQEVVAAPAPKRGKKAVEKTADIADDIPF